jgi:hypothetical protein
MTLPLLVALTLSLILRVVGGLYLLLTLKVLLPCS